MATYLIYYRIMNDTGTYEADAVIHTDELITTGEHVQELRGKLKEHAMPYAKRFLDAGANVVIANLVRLD
jgi:hypothetical protein